MHDFLPWGCVGLHSADGLHASDHPCPHPGSAPACLGVDRGCWAMQAHQVTTQALSWGHVHATKACISPWAPPLTEAVQPAGRSV